MVPSPPRPHEVRSRPGAGIGPKPGEDHPPPQAAEPATLAPRPRPLRVGPGQPSNSRRRPHRCSLLSHSAGGSPFVTGRGGAPGVSDSLLPVAPTAVVAVMAPATIVAVTPTVIVVVALPIQGSCAHCCPFPPGNALMRSLRFIRYPPSRPVSRYSQQTASYSREQAGA